jgi:hypothetical protein
MADRSSLRLSAGLMFLGLLFYLLIGFQHAERDEDHALLFAKYAAANNWLLIHLGRFAAMATVTAGLVVLSRVLGTGLAGPAWPARFGAGSAVAALALYGVVQAVDGVALKQVATAWVDAPEAEKAPLFAAAQAVRWLEWGVRSYHSFMLGLTFLLYAAAIIWAEALPALLGALVALTGLAYVVHGFVVGVQGYTPISLVPSAIAYTLWLVWAAWLRIVAWRVPQADGS